MGEKTKGAQEGAQEKALRLLEHRARSSAEISERLKEAGFSQGEIERVLRRLQHCGLLDDERFARDMARTLGEGRGYGPRRIVFELVRRGIPRQRAEEVIEEAYGEEGMYERARRLLVKKFGPDIFRPKDRRLLVRAQRFLLSRGYDFEQVKGLLDLPEQYASEDD